MTGYTKNEIAADSRYWITTEAEAPAAEVRYYGPALPLEMLFARLAANHA